MILNHKIEHKIDFLFSKVDRFIFFIICSYFFLDNGFLAPLIFGFPIGISGQLLLIPLITYYFYTSKVKINLIISLILLWNLFTFLSILRSFPSYGFQSLRTATYCIDSNYIIIGNLIAQSHLKRLEFPKIFWKILFWGNVYLLLLPLRGFLINFSPQLTAYSGYSVPLLFSFGNTQFFSFIFFFSENSFPLNGQKIIPKLLSFVTIIFTFTYQAARYNYFIFAILGFYTFIKKPTGISKFIIYFILGIIILSIVLSFGIKFSFRGGDITNIRYFFDHFLSSFGISSGSVDGESSGLSLRTSWWLQALRELSSSINNIIFGLGQGRPFTNFYSSYGVLVKTLHNSYIQILVRDGILGASIFTLIHIKLFSNLIHNIRVTTHQEINNFYHVSLLFILSILVNATMQGALEVSYRAIPYYFIFGLAGSYKIETNNK